MRSVMWAELRMHPRRVLSAGVAVLMGVAFVVTGFGATETMKQFIRDSVAARATKSDVVVSGDAFDSLPEKLPEVVEAVPGVRHSEPVYRTFQEIGFPAGRDFVQVISAPEDPRLQWMDVSSGRLPRGTREVAVDSGTAQDLKISPGDSLSIPVETPGEPTDGTAGETAQEAQEPTVHEEKVRVVGVVDFHLSPEVPGRTVLAVNADLIRWGHNTPQEVNVLGAPGTDPVALRESIAKAVEVFDSGEINVRTGEDEAQARADSLTGDVDVLGGFLLGFAGIAMLVAALVISNTFTIILAQRTRQLALLRCVGATRKQVFRSVVVESLAVGVVAALLGIASGMALTAGGTWAVGQIWPDAATTPVFSLTGILVSFAVGVVVTLFSALFPARRSTRVAPLAALRPDTASQARRTSRLRIAFGLLTGIMGSALLFLGTQLTSDGPGPGVLVGIGGGAFALLGVLLVGPVLVPAVARILGKPLNATGPAGRIAVGNAVRNPGRASATCTALLVGVCLMTMMTVGSACVTKIGNDELNSGFPVDMAVTTTPGSNKLTEAKIEQIAQVGGVDTVAPVWRHEVTLKTPQAEVRMSGWAGDPTEIASVTRNGKAPAPGTALMSSGNIKSWGLVEGQKVTVRNAGRSLTLTLRVISVEGLLLSDQDLSRLAPRIPPEQVWLRAENGVKVSDFEKDLRQVVKDVPGSSVEGPLAQRAVLDQVMSVLLWIVTGLLGVALLIAIVGIGNTLSLSVLERTRESGVQRALGMTRRQLRLSLAVEALLLAGVGTAIGVVLGIVFGWLGTRTLLAGVTESFPLVVPVPRLLMICAVAAVAGVLASVLPSRKAARIPPTQALATE
jgi:putative ABC transport system permease protein